LGKSTPLSVVFSFKVGEVASQSQTDKKDSGPPTIFFSPPDYDVPLYLWNDSVFSPPRVLFTHFGCSLFSRTLSFAVLSSRLNDSTVFPYSPQLISNAQSPCGVNLIFVIMGFPGAGIFSLLVPADPTALRAEFFAFPTLPKLLLSIPMASPSFSVTEASLEGQVFTP